jgi:hypothetical protein
MLNALNYDKWPLKSTVNISVKAIANKKNIRN